MKVGCECLVVNPLSHLFFSVSLYMFSPPCCTLGWVFPIFLFLGCHITFVSNLWALLGSTFFVAFMVRRGWPCMMLCKMLLQPLWEMRDFMSPESKPTSFRPLPYNIRAIEFTHRVIGWWCPHVDNHCHCWPHLGWFSFMDFSWGCSDNHGYDKRWFLSWSIPNKNISPSKCRGFWVFTLVSKWVFSMMCQHGMANDRH